MIGLVESRTAVYPHRNASFNFGTLAGWSDPGMDNEVISWARQLYDAMLPYSTGGAYVNYLQGDEADLVQKAYGQNYERLKEIKARYDSHNLFDAHQRICTLADSSNEAVVQATSGDSES